MSHTRSPRLALSTAPSISTLIATARRVVATATDPAAIVAALAAPLREAALAGDWLDARCREVPAEQGFGSHLLHEEADHGLAVFCVAWAPGRGAPPHDHGTWGVVCGVEGTETNIAWRRTDDGAHPGHATLARGRESALSPGDVVTVLPADIHSVENRTDRPSLSLHLYGRHLNFVPRSRFDPVAGTESPFVITVE
jgi:predicted metal-dependent enzyme (double-stranded beta helix superfamily)